MTEDKTITDNEVIALIAEFMGLDVDGQNVSDGQQETTIDRLKYSTSWDWLMPVVEKIESLGCIVEISLSLGRMCRIMKVNSKTQSWETVQESNSLIEAVYKAVLEFITWYNSTTQNKDQS